MICSLVCNNIISEIQIYKLAVCVVVSPACCPTTKPAQTPRPLPYFLCFLWIICWQGGGSTS